MAKDDEPRDASEACFACQNMDAYWAEKAKHDPILRERMAELQRQRAAAQDVPTGDGDRERPSEPEGSGPATP